MSAMSFFNRPTVRARAANDRQLQANGPAWLHGLDRLFLCAMVLMTGMSVAIFVGLSCLFDEGRPVWNTPQSWMANHVAEWFSGTIAALSILFAIGATTVQRQEARRQAILTRYEQVRHELESLSRSIVVKARLLLGTENNDVLGKLDQYDERFDKGRRDIFFAVIERAKAGLLKRRLIDPPEGMGLSLRRDVNRFVSIFEFLLEDCRHLDDDDLMLHMLLYSPVGHVYRALRIADDDPHPVDID